MKQDAGSVNTRLQTSGLPWLTAFMIAAVAVSLYLHTLSYRFLNWDDSAYVYRNPHLKALGGDFIKWAFTTFHFAYWQPLTWISYSVDYTMWGLDPKGYHLTNILLHGLNTFLVVLLAWRFFKIASPAASRGAVLFAASLTGIFFGLHPLRVESVVWISERKDVLYALFFLLSIHFYISYRIPHIPKSRSVFYALSLCSFSLSLMSKPMGLTLPFVFLILDWYPFGRDFRKDISKMVIEKIPFLLLSVGSVAVTAVTIEKLAVKNALPLWGLALVFVKGLLFYLLKMLLPFNLLPLYPPPLKIDIYSLDYLIPLILCICISAGSIGLRKSLPSFLAAGLYYVATLLPTIGIAQAGVALAAADRFTYMPMLGPALFITAGGKYLWDRPGVKRGYLFLASILIAVALSAATINQSRIWKDSKTIWSFLIKDIPGSALLPEFKEHAYYMGGRGCEEAIREMGKLNIADPALSREHNTNGRDIFRQAYEAAVRINPALEKAGDILNMARGVGSVPEARELIEQAICHYKASVMMDSAFAGPHHNLGTAYIALDMDDKAIDEYFIALKLDPLLIDTHYNLAVIYLEKGLNDKARKELETILKLKPDDLDARTLLGELSGN